MFPIASIKTFAQSRADRADGFKIFGEVCAPSSRGFTQKILELSAQVTGLPQKILESRDGAAWAKTTHFDPFLSKIVLNKLTFTQSECEIEPKTTQNRLSDRADSPKIFVGKPRDASAQPQKPHHKPHEAIMLIYIKF